MTLSEALKALGERPLIELDSACPIAPAGFFVWAAALRAPNLRRKVKLTPEGIALPNGQVLYRFADQAKESEPK